MIHAVRHSPKLWGWIENTLLQLNLQKPLGQMLLPPTSMTKPADFAGNKMAQLGEKQCAQLHGLVCARADCSVIPA